jgi:hypothetical protein
MEDTSRIIERFRGGDPVAGNQALAELVALGNGGEDALFSKPVEYPPTVQIRRRWLRYVASRRASVAKRLLERMRNQSQFKDSYAIAFLFAGLPKDSAVTAALYEQTKLVLKSLLDDYDPSTRLFMAWGHAGGDAATLWHFISDGGYAWEKLCTFAFRASCASFARVNASDDWAIEQLIKHEWRDYELVEIGNSPEARIAHESVAGYELWGEANHSLLMWRRGDVADAILRDWSKHQHWRVRDFGAQVLASLGFTRIVSPVVEWLRREEVPTIRRSLLHALERTEREAGADALLEHFLASDEEGRANVARSAWRATDKSEAEAALMRIGDGGDNAAAESMVALARMGHRHPRLETSLDSGDRQFRLNAALAVAYLGDTAKLPHLSAMLRESAAPVERVFLVSALAILGRPNGAAELNSELIAMSNATGFDDRLDIFFMHRYLQIAVLDGLQRGGDAAAELWQVWHDELQPLDPVPEPVEVAVAAKGSPAPVPHVSQQVQSVPKATVGGGSPRKIRLFLASSSELESDRDAFDLYFRQRNDQLLGKGFYLEIVRWENFLDAMSDTRLQDEYNKAIRGCDIFVSLFFTKTGKFTEEEFDIAHRRFKSSGKPLIYTFFKNADIKTGSAPKEDLKSLWAFQDKLKELGHFHTVYDGIEHLKRQFRDQLDKLLEQYD